MTAIRGIYEEIMTDLISKGFGGLVSQIDHDYKNDIPQRTGCSCTSLKTKNETRPTQAISKNETATVDPTVALLPIEVVN